MFFFQRLCSFVQVAYMGRIRKLSQGLRKWWGWGMSGNYCHAIWIITTTHAPFWMSPELALSSFWPLESIDLHLYIPPKNLEYFMSFLLTLVFLDGFCYRVIKMSFLNCDFDSFNDQSHLKGYCWVLLNQKAFSFELRQLFYLMHYIHPHTSDLSQWMRWGILRGEIKKIKYTAEMSDCCNFIAVNY